MTTEIGRSVWMMAFVSLALCAAGCSSREVTGLSKYHVGFVPDRVYVLNVDRELYQTEHRNDVYGLDTPGAVAEDLVQWRIFIDTLPSGVRVRIEELRYETSVDLGGVNRVVAAYGCILDPPHTGKRISMSGVSDYESFQGSPLPSIIMKPKPALIDAPSECSSLPNAISPGLPQRSSSS